jgi:hypothetical protein
MRFRFWACLGPSLQICVSAMADPAAASKISEVIVYADRARVSREVTVNVPEGDSQFELTDLTWMKIRSDSRFAPAVP